MTHPSFFRSTAEDNRELIERHPLATLVVLDSCGEKEQLGLLCAHIPLFLVSSPDSDATWVLRGHMSKQNTIVKPILARGGSAQTLVLFRGFDGYVSPSYYPSKHLDGKQVPTWNYSVVELRGTLRLIDDSVFLHALLRQLSNQEEVKLQTNAHNCPDRPWTVEEAPPDYIDELVKLIVGVEVRVTSRLGRYKLSQNRQEVSDVVCAIENISRRGDDGLAEAMKCVCPFYTQTNKKDEKEVCLVSRIANGIDNNRRLCAMVAAAVLSAVCIFRMTR